MDLFKLAFSKYFATIFVGLFLFAFTAQAAMLAPVSSPEGGMLQPTNEVGSVHIAAIEDEENLLALSIGETGLNRAAQEADIAGEKRLPILIGQVIGVILGLVGVIFLIVMIYGGFQYLTAGGNKDQVNSAVSYIKNGAIGAIIIFASYALVNFVVGGILDATSGSQAQNQCAVATGKPTGCACTGSPATECSSGTCTSGKCT